MAGVVHRQITLTVEDNERLHRRARALGVSDEDLIREMLRQALGNEASDAPSPNREEARKEWAEIMALMRARAGVSVSSESPATGRGWTREDAYEERLERLSR
ncbi:MAG: ribbon-helix-helix protein, CopG family [Chloroflexi bacterium]|nr:ribbon-helix-helix protein, CopG family [Chloroflexota bacterium]